MCDPVQRVPVQCYPDQRPGVPPDGRSSYRDALELVLSGLRQLAGEDVAAVPACVLADGLRGLEDAESLLTAARAGVLSAFERCRGFEDDGQGTARTWLRWQTRVSNGAASGSVGWMRRLRAHRLVAEVLAGAGISASWARQVCEWTELLPAGYRDEADAILLRAVADGADLKDLAVIAEELRDKLAEPDGDGPGGAGPGSGGDGLGGLGRPDGSDPLRDGRVWFGTTTGGAGRLEGDLSAGCSAALAALLESLGKKAGPEDTRTLPQRQHDALHEGLRRLVASGGLPDRAGQPTQIQLCMSLEELLRRQNGSAGAGHGHGTGDDHPVPSPVPGWPVAAAGEECDASVVPIVTGALDHDLLARLVEAVNSPLRGADLTLDGTARVRLDTDSVRDLIIANAGALFSGPGGWRPGCAAASLRGSAGRSACRWTPAPPPRPSRRTCAAR